MKNNKAVFIDRDGTINRDVPYCSKPEDFELLQGAAKGIRLLNELGFKIVIITNQSGIARGFFSVDTLDKIHEKMRQELSQYGAHIDAVYYCPHHPDDCCDCRKPNQKLILQATSAFNINLKRSFVIGDSISDIALGESVGCTTFFIGNYQKQYDKLGNSIKVNNILEAAEEIQRRERAI